jgi:hypothetical protein
MMSVGEVDTKERILMTRIEYPVLKEKIKYGECGWSDDDHFIEIHVVAGACRQGRRSGSTTTTRTPGDREMHTFTYPSNLIWCSDRPVPYDIL